MILRLSIGINYLAVFMNLLTFAYRLGQTGRLGLAAMALLCVLVNSGCVALLTSLKESQP
ncbi:MAG: hypothetical protein A2Y38_15475 [Spirochaetes bacterium GWB1_59_5]|nr:MAG: hypothetical protein A2Y38_15475 [Spirochaetes bacterium GWB1_59_5]